ncbi:WD40/YVTN/BNR-like repeat-containing protein [Paenibacillus sp. GYB003]|uniref:WD40/YVTN/BNR-like repeat-containing protein n=1 Tax=Paenibacillus sp. GYB003 TaxID=2994392 RepID=UPI002F969EB4
MTRSRLFQLVIGFVLIAALMAGCQKPGDATQGSAPQTPAADAPAPAPNAPGPNSGAAEPAPAPSGPENGAGSAQKPPSAVKMDAVTAVRLADPLSGWIGGNGWIARTEDGGKTWSPQYSGSGTVRQLFALNGQEAWATIAADGASESDKAGDRRLLATKDGGNTWTAAGTVPNGGFLHFVSPSEAFSANAKTTDGGRTWTQLPVPDQTVGDAYFHDAKNGWAVTQQKDTISVKRTTDGGESWQTVMSKKTVAMLTGTVIRSAGADDAWVLLVGESGMTQTSYSLFHTQDGGKTWQTVLANSTAGGGPAPGFPIDHSEGPKNGGSKPGALYVVSPNVAFMGGQCMACDKPNTIGLTTDGGKTWVNREPAYAGYGEQRLAFADAKHGWWILTDNAEPAVMYTTADGGVSWTKVHTFEKPKPSS